MNYNLEQVMLEVAKDYLKSLDNEQFLALTCDFTILHNGLIRLVYNQSILRNVKAPVRNTADVFLCTKGNIKHFLRKHEKCETGQNIRSMGQNAGVSQPAF